MGFIIYKLVCKNFPFHLSISLGDPSTQGFGGLPHHRDVPIGTAKMKRLASPSGQEDVEKTKLSFTSVETEIGTSTLEIAQQFLRKSNLHLPSDPAVLLLDV